MCISKVSILYIISVGLSSNPVPPDRIVLDAVSDLNREIILSLKCGSVRCSLFSLIFHRDVFNFLFTDKGRPVSHKRGKCISVIFVVNILVLIVLFF